MMYEFLFFDKRNCRSNFSEYTYFFKHILDTKTDLTVFQSKNLSHCNKNVYGKHFFAQASLHEINMSKISVDKTIQYQAFENASF